MLHFNGENGSNPQGGVGGKGPGVIFGHDGKLYGTTFSGGSANRGTVFSLEPDGFGGFTHMVILNFSFSNGSNPSAGLTLGTDGTLYGTTVIGGSGGRGRVFALMPDGSGRFVHTVLANFNRLNGGKPIGGVTLGSDGALYGTGAEGPKGEFAGVVYRVRPKRPNNNANHPPSLNFDSAPFTIIWGQSFEFSFTVSDPEGDARSPGKIGRDRTGT